MFRFIPSKTNSPIINSENQHTNKMITYNDLLLEVMRNNTKKSAKFGATKAFDTEPSVFFKDIKPMGHEKISGVQCTLYRKSDAIYLVDDNIQKTILAVSFDPINGGKTLTNLFLSKNRKFSTVKAHFFYHVLITKHNITLMTDSQSDGAIAVWQLLSHMPNINIYGWIDGEARNVDINWDADVVWGDGDAPDDFEDFALVATRK